MPEFQPYLDAIIDSALELEDWRDDRYVPTAAQLPLQVKTIVDKKSDGSSLSQKGDEESPRAFGLLQGLREFYTHEPVLLIGKPGSGKSTALRRLLLEEAEIAAEALTQDSESLLRIPVLILLRSCDHGDVLDWIGEALEDLDLEKAKIRSLLKDGRLLLLFDGLNEVPNLDVYRSLTKFLEKWTNRVLMVFTTRALGADSALGISRKLEMMPLSELQMREFIEKRLPGRSDEMLRQLGDRLRELAETPLLLNMLCQVFDQSGEIPKSRGELFRNKFIQDFDAIKHKGVVAADSLFFDYKDEILQHLAMKMIVGDNTPTGDVLQVEKSTAQAWITEYLTHQQVSNAGPKAKEWLHDLLEHHILQIADKTKDIEFHHQLFQEYYAAEWLLERVGKLDDETLECDYLNYLKWTEPLALMLALVDDEALAVRVVDRALAVDLMLGARLAGEVRSEFQEKTVELVNTLEMTDSFKIYLLEKTRSDKSISELFKISRNAKKDIYLRCIDAIGKIDSTESIRVLITILENSNNDISLKIIRILGKMKSKIAHTSLLDLYQGLNDKCKIRAAQILKRSKFITNLPIELINENAVSPVDRNVDRKSNELKEILKEHKSKLNFLCLDNLLSIVSEEDIPVLSHMLKSDDSYLRYYATQSLVNIGGDLVKPDLLEAVRDDEWDIRLIAAGFLAREGSDLAVVAICKSLEESSSDARLEAVTILGDVGDHRVTPFLIKAFLEEDDTNVRLVIVESMQRIGGDSAMLGLRYAISDPESDVCNAAIEALGPVGGDKVIPALLNLIEKEAVDDVELQSGSDLCHSAIQSLGNLKSKAAISELIKLVESPTWFVRIYAVKALSVIDSPELISIFLNAMNDHVYDVRRKAAIGLSKYQDERIPAILPKFLTSFLSSSDSETAESIRSIQNIQSNCKFYNYEIHQKTIDRKPIARGNPTIPYEAELVQIIENNYGTVIGNHTQL